MELITKNIQKRGKTDQIVTKYLTVFSLFLCFFAKILPMSRLYESYHCTTKGKRPTWKHDFLMKIQHLRQHETPDGLMIGVCEHERK